MKADTTSTRLSASMSRLDELQAEIRRLDEESDRLLAESARHREFSARWNNASMLSLIAAPIALSGGAVAQLKTLPAFIVAAVLILIALVLIGVVAVKAVRVGREQRAYKRQLAAEAAEREADDGR